MTTRKNTAVGSRGSRKSKTKQTVSTRRSSKTLSTRRGTGGALSFRPGSSPTTPAYRALLDGSYRLEENTTVRPSSTTGSTSMPPWTPFGWVPLTNNPKPIVPNLIFDAPSPEPTPSCGRLVRMWTTVSRSVGRFISACGRVVGWRGGDTARLNRLFDEIEALQRKR